MTHGGLLSVMEAIYHETIVVGIPLANDQVRIILKILEYPIKTAWMGK